MAVIKMKPTSPGQRAVVKISRDHLFKGEPYAPLLEPKFQKAGRNNNGRITVRPAVKAKPAAAAKGAK